MMITVVVADSQRIVCEGIKLILEREPDMQVVGFASTVDEAVSMCERCRPNVVLMDANMKSADGTDGTERILIHSDGATKVIVLSKDEEGILQAISNGANGYVLKTINSEELILTIKSTVRGLSVMHQEAFSGFARQMRNAKKSDSSLRQPWDVSLTKRELEIIHQVIEGKENREIAKSLYISEGTVKNTISGILKKLNLKTRIQLVVFALRNDIGA